MAILDAVAVCSAADRSSSVLSAFVQHRCFVSSQQTSLARTSSRCPQRTSTTPVMVALTTSGTEEEDLETLPTDDTFSVRGSWREITYPGTRPSTTASKNFDDVAGNTGGAFLTRFLGFRATTVSAPDGATWFVRYSLRLIAYGLRGRVQIQAGSLVTSRHLRCSGKRAVSLLSSDRLRHRWCAMLTEKIDSTRVLLVCIWDKRDYCTCVWSLSRDGQS